MHIHHFFLALRHILFWILISIALLLTTTRLLMTGADKYKPQLEELIRQTSHIPLRIGKVQAKMRGFSPNIILQNIAVDDYSSASSQALQLKEVRIGFDALNWLFTHDLLSATTISLVGANISVLRQLDGSLQIKGLQSNDNEKPLWLLQGRRYQILESSVSWQDLKNNGQQVNFQHFNLLIKNTGDNHEVHLLTMLPEAYGQSLRISALLKGQDFNEQNITGQLYIEGVDLQGPALVNHDLPLDLHVESGSGDVRVWSDWQASKPYRIAGYMQAQQIKLSNPTDYKLQIDTIAGNFHWLTNQQAQRLAVYDVDISAQHQLWSDAEFALQHDAQGHYAGLIKHLDLQALSHIAPLFLTTEHPLFDWLKLKPSGQLNDLKAYVQQDGQHYAVKGQFINLGITALNAIPNIQGVSGWVQGNDSQGRIDLASQNLTIEANQLFSNKLKLNRLQGGIAWQQQAGNWQFTTQNLTINSPDFQTQTDFNLVIPNGTSSPYLEIQTNLTNFNDVSRLSHYLPDKIMDKDAFNWLNQAFVSGQINQGELNLRGNLDQFPFTQGQGLFEMILQVENGELQYNPDWPHIHDMKAEIQYLGEDLTVAINNGESENVEIKQLLVKIYALPESIQAELTGQLQSKLQNALVFLQKTPLHNHVDLLLKILKLESTTQVDLDLTIPYHANQDFGIKVAAHLNNAGLTLKPINLNVGNINGILNFTETTINSDKLTATTLGFPIQGVLTSDSAAEHLKISGSTSLESLQNQFSFLQNDLASGVFNYQSELFIPHSPDENTSLQINSNLQGVTISGDDFISKTADQTRQFQLNFAFPEKAMLPIKLHYGENLQAALLVDTDHDRLYSGDIVLGNSPAEILQQAGLKLEIKQPQFKLAQAMGAFSNSGESRWPALREISLDTQQLVWQGKNLGAIQCHFQHSDQVWQGSINSPMAKGQLTIPDRHPDDNPIKLEMDYLDLSAISSLNLNATEADIDFLPLIDINSQQLLWRSVNLGKLKLRTDRLNNGIQFKKINISGANKDIDLKADWIKQNNGSSTLVSGSLRMDNFGQFLADLGFNDDIKETHADINFTGGWSGTPQQFSIGKLNGQLQAKLNDGRISSIEPGFGRLLGLVSMEQWVKRLSLDFSDIYRQGLAFNSIKGSIKFMNGVAYTEDLLIDAVAAKMQMIGSANLVDKTLDQHVRVIPKSSDAVPIAGTIVGGIAAIITNAVTDDYKEGYFFGSEYKIAGQWSDIQVTPVKDQDGLVNKTWRGLTDFGWLK